MEKQLRRGYAIDVPGRETKNKGAPAMKTNIIRDLMKHNPLYDMSAAED